MNIYSICNEFLSMIIDNLDNNYNNQEKEKAKLLELLTGKTDFNKVLKIDLSNTELTEDELRVVMMLIIASKAYLYDNYARFKEIIPDDDSERFESIIDTIEEMSYKDVITLFTDQDDLAYILIESFLCYYDLTYIGQSQCKEHVFNDKEKLKHLMALNPFEFFNISDFIGNNDMLQSEIIIQDFFDIYEGKIGFVDTESDDEISNFTEEDEELFAKFLEVLREKYSEEYVNSFLLYMCANVYEILTSKPKFSKDSDVDELVTYFSETETSQILNDLKTDYKFAGVILNYFYQSNMYISREELSRRRIKFKKKNKDLTKIKNLNPYFDSEEKVFTRKKVNHLD